MTDKQPRWDKNSPAMVVASLRSAIDGLRFEKELIDDRITDLQHEIKEVELNANQERLGA